MQEGKRNIRKNEEYNKVKGKMKKKKLSLKSRWWSRNKERKGWIYP